MVQKLLLPLILFILNSNFMNQTNLSIGDIASALGGAGLTMITSNLNVALMLIGSGVVLKVLVAVLNKNDIPVSSPLG